LLNNKRIKEAQRLLADNQSTKYTIEFIAEKVGFKSQSAFRNAFKENTGVNPHFYLKSVKDQKEKDKKMDNGL
jgi:transcriptional regulator GlxA family with amidase domain